MRNPDWVRDEIILAMAVYFRAGRKQLPPGHHEVLQLSRLLNDLPIHPKATRGANFRNPNGISMVLGNFLGIDPLHDQSGLSQNSHLQAEVWRDFADNPKALMRVADAIKCAALDIPAKDDNGICLDDVFQEGKLLTRQHFYRERNRSAVSKKTEQTLTKTGKLECEVCGFDFVAVYGELGHGFAEYHHILPLAEAAFVRTTHLRDLAIVCANCHRMLHRARPPLTIDRLRGVIMQHSKQEAAHGVSDV